MNVPLELEVFRLRRLPARTPGELYADGQHFAYTCEDTIRDEKIPGVTAIPCGRYRVTLEYSPKYGPDTLTINNVPGFTGIRIHSGNTETDTEGCLLVGQSLRPDGTIAGGTSRPAVADLKALVKAALSNGRQCFITLYNPE